MGRGMGMGQGIGGVQPPAQPGDVGSQPPSDDATETAVLKKQVDALQKQLEQMTARMKELETNEEPSRET